MRLKTIFFILHREINMTPNIKVALIGGTGKAGKYLLKQLLAQGFPVKFLHRQPETLQIDNPLVEIVKGDARNYDAIHSLLQGCDAVMNCISQPVGEESIFSDATRNILKAMPEFGISRYLVLAGLNVDTPNDQKSPQTQAGTNWMKTHYPKTTADRQVEYELMAESNTDWTMVRLPLIMQTDDTGPTAVSLQDCPGGNISATDLALFLIAQLTDVTYIKQAPFIASMG
jgi:putative NADH-flavin reductase